MSYLANRVTSDTYILNFNSNLRWEDRIIKYTQNA